MNKPKICLNMIVKNEEKVLPRLLASVKDIVSYYVIVDTGSTDGTIALIKETMHGYGIQGTVYERPWVNFGKNRQEALELAVENADLSEWMLFLDADEELVVPNPTAFLEKMVPGKSYDIEKHNGSTRYAVPHLLNVRSEKHRWEGAVHEYLVQIMSGSDIAGMREIRKDAWILCRPGEGARSVGITQVEKFLRDAKLLEEELVLDPTNARTVFYLAQSYRDAGKVALAFEKYRERARMPGWDEETFMAELECGRLAIRRTQDPDAVVPLLLRAYQVRPTRAEPLYELAKFYRDRKEFALGALYARAGVGITKPNDRLFVDESVYQWRMLDELAVSAYWIGDYETCVSKCEELLHREVPAGHQMRIKKNLELAQAKLR